MKKIAIGLLCLAGLVCGLLLSCEIPQALTVKGKPGVYLPLGNPLSSLDEDQRLENYISNAKIREMMDNSGAAGKLGIYEYRGSDAAMSGYSNVQVYMVHYPIAEMKVDLSEYINDAIQDADDMAFSYTLPPIISDTPEDMFPAGGYYLSKIHGPQMVENDPLFVVSLADMAKLVKEVNGGPFGLEFDLGNGTDFQGKIWVRMPAFGVEDYIEGELLDGKLRFAGTPADGKFIPKNQSQGGNLNDDDELEIFVKVTGPCSGTLSPEMVFDWTSAIVYTITNESLKGDFQLENLLGGFLGSAVTFKEAIGYIYVNNIDDATLILTSNGADLVLSDHPLTSKPRPIFSDPFAGSLPTSSLDGDTIALAEVLNSDSKLEYQIKIPEMFIENAPESISRTITIDLVILLPLEFRVTDLTYNSSNRYVALELDDMFPAAGDKDLFFREGKDGDLFSNIASVTVLLTHFQNDILDGKIYIQMSDRVYNNRLEFRGGGRMTLGMDTLPFPFTPKFGIVLEKDAGQNYATLKVKRQVNPDVPRKFDFSLAIEAQTDINYTLNFNDKE
ncbi:MAG: hypothetical protein LBI06_05455 [Treponema sp.]|jgi:hypothetical protein|nr:hypothetical protein [Treponema sp.]